MTLLCRTHPIPAGTLRAGRGLSGMRSLHPRSIPPALQRPAAPCGATGGTPAPAAPPGAPLTAHPRSSPTPGAPPAALTAAAAAVRGPAGTGDSPPAAVSLLGPPCIQTGAGLRGNCITAAPPRPARRHRGEQEPARPPGGHRAGGAAPAPTGAPAGTGTATGSGEPAPDRRDRHRGEGAPRERAPAFRAAEAGTGTGSGGTATPPPASHRARPPEQDGRSWGYQPHIPVPSHPRIPAHRGPNRPRSCPAPPGAEGPLPGALLTRSSGFPALRFGPEPAAAAPEF